MPIDLTWHAAALAAKAGGPPPPDLTPYKAEHGFFRIETRDGWTPVAIWEEDGRTVARVGRDAAPLEIADESFCERVFARACKHPVAQEDYWTFYDGGMWPDAPPAVAKSNLPLSANSALKVELEGERQEAERWLKSIGGSARTQEEADRLINWAARIAEIEKKAEDARKREKQPFLDEARAVDDEWNPVKRGAEALKRTLKDATTAFLVAKRKAEEEKLAAARREAAQTGQGPAGVDLTRPAKATAGTVSHVAGIRTVRTAVVEDFAKALSFFAGAPEVRELVQTLADRAVRAGVTPDGCRVEETQKVV